MYAASAARRALDRHPGPEGAGDELSARFTGKSAELSRLQYERVATDSCTNTADNGAGQTFAVARFHDKRTAQRICDGDVSDFRLEIRSENGINMMSCRTLMVKDA